MTAAECQKRIDSFIEVTKTDEAFAQSVLQDHDWNLETALNTFLVSSVPLDGPKSLGPKEEEGKNSGSLLAKGSLLFQFPIINVVVLKNQFLISRIFLSLKKMIFEKYPFTFPQKQK